MINPELEKLNPELSFEVSELNISLDELIEYVRKNYGTSWKFNRTEHRYESCIVAVFEKQG